MFLVRRAQFRFFADVDQAALGIKYPMRSAGVLRQKVRQGGRIVPPGVGRLHKVAVYGLGQRLDGEWMFQRWLSFTKMTAAHPAGDRFLLQNFLLKP